jgi:hypothetical protein
MCQLGWCFQNKRTVLDLAALKGDDTITKALENAKLDGQALVEAGSDVKGVQADAHDHYVSQRTVGPIESAIGRLGPNAEYAIGDENDR